MLDQTAELANLVKAEAIFCTAGFVIGLWLSVFAWGVTVKMFHASKMSGTDKGAGYAVTSFIAAVLIAGMISGICYFGPQIIAPTGVVIRAKLEKENAPND